MSRRIQLLVLFVFLNLLPLPANSGPANEITANLSASAIFSDAPAYGSGGYQPQSAVVADVNGDGKPDLVVANRCGTSNCMSSLGSVAVLLGNGDGSFQAPIAYSSGGWNATSVTVADVNRDGKPDLVVAHQCANSTACTNGVLGVLLGNGDGTFQAAQSYSSGGQYGVAVAIADFNGDSKPDLVVANECPISSTCTNSVVAVLLGNGDGSFQPAVVYASGGEGASFVTVADLNGDGKLDAVVVNQTTDANSNNGIVGVLLGNGDGSFQSVVAYGSGGGFASSVAIADVNGDGRPDLLVANWCPSTASTACDTDMGAVGVLLGNGDGTFQAPSSYQSGGQLANSVAVADVNGDGHPDLVVANECTISGCGDGIVTVLLGVGNGTFLPPTASYDSGGSNALLVIAQDLNGDGRTDLLVLNECVTACTSGVVSILLGNSDGTFRGTPTYTSAGWGNSSMTVADVNGDGKPDLLVANECPTRNCTNTNGSVAVLLGNGDGTFQTAVTYGSGGFEARSIAVADVNGDGKLDILVANSCASNDCTTGVLSVLLGNGDGTFQSAVPYNSGGTYAYSVAVADVNGDGKPDVLVSHYYAYYTGPGSNSIGAVGVLLGNGDGTFQPAVSYGSGGLGAVSMAVADVNRDGKPDVMVANLYGANSSYGKVGVLLGNGDGTFQPATSYPAGGQFAESIAVGDVNGDGVSDLLVSNQCNYGVNNCANLGVLFGNGDGTFQPVAAIAAPTTDYNSLALADFNGDGKLDIASGSGGFLLLGNGNGTFQPSLLLGASGPSIAVGDFNLDGQPDLAVAGVAILLNVYTVPKTKTATATTLISSLQSPTYGQNVTFTATVTPQGTGLPTGVVTFTDGAATLGTVSVTNRSAELSTSALLAGTHYVKASYSGDSNFVASASPQLAQGVNRATSPTKLVSSANPSYLNQSVTFTATVTSQYGGALTGNVTFKQGATELATMALASGQATRTTMYTTTGMRYISAVYSGDGNNQISGSSVLNQVVNSLPAATTTKVTSSGSPSLINQSVTFTAAITSTYGPVPNGEIVTFYDATTPIGTGATTSGVATFSISTLTAKTHTIKATYPGDATFKASSGTVAQVVNLYPSTISVPTSSWNPSTYGQSVTLRATVTSTAPSTPTGTVNFKNGTTSLGTATLNSSGVAALTKANIPAGTDSITAVYNGDSETAKSISATLMQTVNQTSTTTTVKSSLNPSLLGQSVTFTATVTSPTTTPSGSVTLMDGTNVLGTVTLSGNKASYITSTLSTGSHSIAAVYNGTANIRGSTSSALIQTVY